MAILKAQARNARILQQPLLSPPAPPKELGFELQKLETPVAPTPE